MDNPPKTPPHSRNTSSGDNHAAEAPQVPPPEFTKSRVNDPALSATDPVALAAGALSHSIATQNDTKDDCEAITAIVDDASLDAALISSSTAGGQGKGKGKDPEIYNTTPTEDGNTEDRLVNGSAADNDAAMSLMLYRYGKKQLHAVSILLDLGGIPYEGEISPFSPSTVAKDAFDYLHSSESEDEGPILSTVRKVGFSTCCHGNHLQHCAHDGDAVFDLSLSSRRDRRSHLRHDDLNLHNGETQCRRCEAAQESLRARYMQGYRNLGCEGFEREDTVPLDDDAADSSRHERYGAAEYDAAKHGSEMLSTFPQLSQKTFERLEAEKWAWRPEPDPLVPTVPDDSVSVDDVVEPDRLPMYAVESNTRGSVSHSNIIDPEATAEQTAHDAPPPPSSQRPSYIDRRSGLSYPLAAEFVNLTKSISSPFPSTRQKRREKAAAPSPLKQVRTAVDSDQTSPSPEQRSLPTRNAAPLLTAGPVSQMILRSRRRNVNTPNHSPPKGPKGTAALTEAGTSTPQKRNANPSSTTTTNAAIAAPLPTPPASGRKRKAATQPEPQPSSTTSPSSSSSSRPTKKRKGQTAAASTSAHKREEDALDAAVAAKRDFYHFVDAQGEWAFRWVDGEKGWREWEGRAGPARCEGVMGDIRVNAKGRKEDERRRREEGKASDEEARVEEERLRGEGWVGLV